MKNLKSFTGIFLTILALTFSLSSSAQGTGEIRGWIVDSLTNDPVPFATVAYSVAGTMRGTVADEDGYFKIKPLNPGFYDLNFRSVGYKQKKINRIRVNSDKSKNIGNVHLSNGSIKEIVIIEYREKLINEDDPTAISLGIADIEISVVKLDPIALIASTTSDIKMSADGKKLYFRGERAEAVMYIVDGVKTRDGSLGIPGSAIGHLTVYTGGVPAKYGDFTGGVVVIETKSYFDLVRQRSMR